ncbi:MAG: hypothetical protein WCA10_24750 [Terracidiphilus sp.]
MKLNRLYRERTLTSICRSLGLLACTLVVIASPAIANAKISVKPKIVVDGRPARHALVSIYNCKSNQLEAGPFSTADDGSVYVPEIDSGDHCLKAEIPSGFGTKEVQLDEKGAQQEIDLTEIVPRLNRADRVVPATLCFFTFLMVIYPIGRYLAKPWAFRRDYLIAQLSGESMKLYYQQFRAGASIKGKEVGDPSLNDGDYTEAFAHDFRKWYGRRYYIFPIMILAVLTGICGWWGCLNLWDWISGVQSLESMRGLVAAAIAGAFVWIIADEIDRLRRRDFTSFDLYYYIFRILIAVPFGWALTRLQVTLQVGIPVAFFLGAFPTSTLFTLARRLAGQQLKLGEDPASGKLELESLQSVGKEIAERFKDEGVYTITQLAYADPLDLTIRCNFDFNYVVDCVSQSLLWIYLGDKVKDLQPFSLRGAQEVAYFYTCLTQSNPDPKAVAALQEIASDKLKMSKEALQCTLEQVAGDPYTKFLCKIWT